MNARFAMALPRSEVASLGAVRRWQGLEVCEADDAVWLRAANLDDDQWDFCRRLPGADRFTLTDDGRLLAVGMLVPRGKPPAGPWLPIAQWLRVELPTTDSAPPPPSPAALSLVRSTTPRNAAWLLTDFETWARYAASAPQVRLSCWSFAVDSAGRALVRGTPLPPLAGTQLAETDGIAVPLGYTWSPGVATGVLRQVFRLEAGDALLWTADGVRRRIAAADWVRAIRSAVRLTRDELARRRLAADDPLGGGTP
jgi:hypothetical protein